MIRCASNALYTGITKNPERRLREHCGESGRGARALRGRGPLQIAWCHPVANRSEASRLEYRIKRMRKHQKEQLVRGGDIDI